MKHLLRLRAFVLRSSGRAACCISSASRNRYLLLSVCLPGVLLPGRAEGAWAREEAPAAADSATVLEARLKAKGEKGVSAPDYLSLGDAYLRGGDFGRARDAYKKALDLDKGSVEAQYGLAYTSFKETSNRGLKAALSNRRTFGEVRKVLEMAPQFAPTYLLYGLCLEWLKGDYERAIFHYEKYLKMRPEDPEGVLALVRACLEAKRFKQVEDTVLPYLKRHPEERRLLPVAGHYLLTHGRPAEAAEAFARYVGGLEPSERALYEDIRAVASKEEAAEYERLLEAERTGFLKRFWAKRDADILTEANEGLTEHYRRVWYARSHFSRRVEPWDRRGEVYIRYGEPDYRASSSRLNVYQSPAVQRVKERMAQVLYGSGSVEEVYVGPVFPVRGGNLSITQAAQPRDQTEEIPGLIVRSGGDASLPPSEPLDPNNPDAAPADASKTIRSTSYAPVTLRNDQSLVAWESWVYVNVAGGIEITFTDEMGDGNYEFAPMPAMDVNDQGLVSRMAHMLQFAPKTVYDRALGAAPDDYRVMQEGAALGFYYDTADFRGPEGETRLEVVYGLPTKEFSAFSEGDTTGVAVERAVALATKDHSRVYRSQGEAILEGRASLKKTRGEIIPDLVRLQVPPGEYQLAIQVKDKVSGRTGLYKQDLTVKPYAGDQLQISDIALAFAILDSAAAPQFRKGGVYVLPMPTRAYGEGQSAAAYYEVYNLKKDAKGHTRYKVEYSIRAEVEGGYGLLGKTSSGLQKLFGSRKPQVSVTYERAGTEESDAGYLTLDLKRLKPGVNRLRVAVTDLVSQEKSEKDATFRYGK